MRTEKSGLAGGAIDLRALDLFFLGIKTSP
jgi:hypothetical protein